MGAAGQCERGRTMLALPRSSRSVVGVLALVALVVGSIAVATPASAAKKKSKPVALATATGWLDVATAAKLTAAGAPQQITDTSSPNLAQMSALLSGLRSRASEPRRTRAPRPIPAIRRPP